MKPGINRNSFSDSNHAYAVYSKSSIVQNHDVRGPSVGTFGDDAWSPGAHEWDGSPVISHSTASTELYVPIHLENYFLAV